MPELVAYGFVGKDEGVLYRMGIKMTYPYILILGGKALILSGKCLIVKAR